MKSKNAEIGADMSPDYFTLKTKIQQHCIKIVEERISQTEEEIKEIRQEAQLHAKSSAGDKYETGRAMADLEIEKYEKSLNNLLQMQAVLMKIDPETHHHEMAHGTLIHTEKELIYVAIALGKTKVDGKEVLVISYEAPLFTCLKNTPIGKTAVFNGRAFKILGIV